MLLMTLMLVNTKGPKICPQNLFPDNCTLWTMANFKEMLHLK